ncbi:hypothetical protein DACRYDRAFT_110811 [Dacryopinax primogenitus]|uniref:Uncharacterized protein n=1 Tax=Dacryopinax primogenitus (strain DJM 731) TaxID=1858805 RepID=M5FSV3_DACPD|nr:uncharacterized protein DACRYDRAFT_110811 [Dacryopinax primogenitus]EJT98369.1 hypothetical protein DACRYDRAFT_110811 [Dacryopinax primogenitus]
MDSSPNSTFIPPSVPLVTSAGPGTAANSLVGGLTALGLYGFFCALFGLSIHILFRRRQEHVNYFLLTASVLIFVLTTLVTVLECNRLLLGLLFTPPGLTPDIYFSGAGTWTYALQLSGCMANILVADAVMLYRVWVVWGKRWSFVVVNAILWFATLGSAIRVIQLEVNGVRNPVDFANLLLLAHWSTAVPALSLGQTVIATALISFRLYHVERSVAGVSRKSLYPIMRIVIESGAIYTVLMIIETVTQAVPNAISASLLFFQLISPCIGITFSLIVVRVGLGISKGTPLPKGNGGFSSNSDPINFSVRRTGDTQGGVAYDDASMLEEGDEGLEMKGLGSSGNAVNRYTSRKLTY